MSDVPAPALTSLAAAVTAAAARAPGHDQPALAALRRTGAEHFRAAGLPHQRLEDWKYTSVRAIERAEFALAGTTDGTAGGALDEHAGLGAGADAACTLVFVDGTLAGRIGAVPDGVTALGLDEALAREPEAVLRTLGQLAQPTADGFAALSAAACLTGVYLHVRAGVSVAQPINLVFVARADGRAALPRTVVHIGEGASARVVEHFVGAADIGYLNNTVTEARLDAGARLELSRLQEDGARAFHVNTTAARLARGARFTSNALSVGARIARHDINVWLDEPDCECVLNGLYLGAGRQHVDFHTRIFHAAPDCTSRQLYKGILDGHARGVFNGQVHVMPGAQHSDAEQSNRNLLLSRNAEVDTKPQLEIYADDVKCAHGTTVGQLDEQMLFYLRSRGVPEPQARGLLTYGFAHDIAERLTLDSLRGRVEQVLMDVLPHGEELKALQ